MNITDFNLKFEEKAVFALRSLYSGYGYSQFKMNKFEEYDLYVKNKDFLISDNVITFTDTNGKLMALKPDVTLSIVKNSQDTKGVVEKLYYNENVYRVSKDTNSFQEIMQVGLECIGDMDTAGVSEVLTLAGKSLKVLSENSVLSISHLGIIAAILDSNAEEMTWDAKGQILKCIEEKNTHELESICKENGMDDTTIQLVTGLISTYGKIDEVLPRLKDVCQTPAYIDAYTELEQTLNLIVDTEIRDMIQIDFSVVSDTKFYNGLVFKGFIEQIPTSVLSGGQYDRLMKKMKKNSKAMGFAVYLDMLDSLKETEDMAAPRDGKNQNDAPAQKKMLNVALPKGRLGEKVYDMFEKAGFPCPSIKEQNRKLIFENEEAGVRYFWVKPSDVPIYVERGAADIGVAGKDILLEYTPDVYELLDLNLGKCRMAVAAPKGFQYDNDKTLKVATKFVNIAQSYYSGAGRDIDIIPLNGSIEIAPILGLSDVIVDIVETGTTLKENDLEVIETVVPISARLIANKTSFKFQSEAIEMLKSELDSQVMK